ncbi:MAG: baseplate J/gp47 family protein [Aeriscardovia sp.]|nr:baseplate J/gp47 family protein [Aeriscardovia sp.]
MAITFNNQTGLVAEETSVVRARIAQEWKNAFATDPRLPVLDTNPETPAGQLIDGQTALASEKDNDMIYIANMFNPKNATGVWQDALAAIYFLNRKIALPTYVTCQVRGAYGTTIPYGALVQDVNGYTFLNTSVVVIGSSGTANIYVRCTETGAVEVAPNTVTQIVTTVPGWDSVSNPSAGVTGRDEESQAAFENRRAGSVGKNSHGAVASIYGTIADLNNVVAVLVLENTTNTDKTIKGVTLAGHSVYISVYGGDNTDIARVIYNKIDGGVGTQGNTMLTYNPASDNIADQPDALYTYYIERPDTVETAVKVTVSDDETTGLTNAIKEAVVENFNGNSSFRRVKMGDTLYASRFYADVIKAGVTMLENIEIKYPSATGSYADSIDIPASELPTISVDDVTVVYQ